VFGRFTEHSRLLVLSLFYIWVWYVIACLLLCRCWVNDLYESFSDDLIGLSLEWRF
jgi:hypothetical protein